QENLQKIFDTIEDFLFVIDIETGSILKGNRVFEKRLGYSNKELLKMNYLDLYPPDRWKEAENVMKTIVNGKKKVCTIPLRTKHGNLIQVETTVYIEKFAGRDVIIGLSRETSENS
ncbi:MAG: PAS domain S-box protein, partial [Promethearchaeota archaeon]